MRRLFLIIILAFCFLHIASFVYAAKPRKKQASQGSIKYSSSSIPYSSARLSRPTNSVILTLTNIDKTAKSTYTLQYKTNGIPQGVVGTVIPTGSTTETRDLYFGTCSHGVCTPHYSISNASLTVVTQSSSGSWYRKRYVIKM